MLSNFDPRHETRTSMGKIKQLTVYFLDGGLSPILENLPSTARSKHTSTACTERQPKCQLSTIPHHLSQLA